MASKADRRWPGKKSAEEIQRERAEAVIETQPTKAEARRAEELIRKYGWEHLRKKR